MCYNNKTQILIFSLREHFDNNENIKLVGVFLDSTMSWNSQVSYLENKISKGIFQICQLRDITSDHTVIIAYYIFIYSLLNYAILVWGHSPYCNNLFRLQRKSMRAMAHIGFRSDCIFFNLKKHTFPCMSSNVQDFNR